MKWKLFVIIFVLFMATALPIAYKTLYLGLDFFPKIKMNSWKIEFTTRVTGSPEEQKFKFPIIEASDRIKVIETQYEGKNLSLTLNKTKEGTFANLSGVSYDTIKAHYKILIQNFKKQYHLPEKDFKKSYPAKVTPFLTPLSLNEDVNTLIERLEKEIDPNTNNKIKIAKTLFYFVHEEIINTKKRLGLEKSLINLKGSSKEKSDILTILLRNHNIPARTVSGIQLIDDADPKRPITYWNEIYLDKQWIPAFTVEGQFGTIPRSFIPLVTHLDLVEKTTDLGNEYEVRAKRILSEEFSAIQYKHQLAKKDKNILSFSPYILPLSAQGSLKIILLFTVGCVVLSICRNLIGIQAFGIFFPILLAIFFKETSIQFGTMFFMAIIAMGFIERRFIQKLHLLAVPRYSIILTLLVITLLIFSILNHQHGFSKYSPTFLPLIITTMFIERFSISVEEEGWTQTLSALVGTFVIAVLSVGVFSWKKLELLIYTYPETLFTNLALLIIIGKYTGYRLSEIFRFRELIKK